MIRTIQEWATKTLPLWACVLLSVAAIAQNGTKPPNGSVVTPVQVVNTPNVNVVNTPTVTLAPGAGVSVVNPLNNQNNPSPLAVLEAIQPYEDSCGFDYNGDNDGTCNMHPVPAGKRLVIEEVDLWGRVEPGTTPTVALLFNPATAVAHSLVPILIGNSNQFEYRAEHQTTRLYVGSGVALQFNAIVTRPSNEGSWSCNLSGFLVDVP
jgi:hypothetical protein